MGGKPHGFYCLFVGNSVHLKHDSTFLYYSNKVINSTLTATHWRFITVTGDWFIRKNSYPDFTTPLNVASHGSTRGFNLAGCYPAVFHSFEAKTTKRHKIARHGFAL